MPIVSINNTDTALRPLLVSERIEFEAIAYKARLDSLAEMVKSGILSPEEKVHLIKTMPLKGHDDYLLDWLNLPDNIRRVVKRVLPEGVSLDDLKLDLPTLARLAWDILTGATDVRPVDEKKSVAFKDTDRVIVMADGTVQLVSDYLKQAEKDMGRPLTDEEKHKRLNGNCYLWSQLKGIRDWGMEAALIASVYHVGDPWLLPLERFNALIINLPKVKGYK